MHTVFLRSTIARAVKQVAGAAALTLVSGLATIASAATVTLLNVTGPGNNVNDIQNGQGLATSFSIDHAITGAELTADIACIEACDGSVFLLKNNVGPTSSLADLVEVRSLSLATSTDPLLSGLNLGPGLYFLLVVLTGNGQGNLGWVTSDPATITVSKGVAYGTDLRADKLDTALPFLSDFQIISDARAMHFRLTAQVDTPDPSAVPLPAGAPMLAAGVLGLALVRRRRA